MAENALRPGDKAPQSGIYQCRHGGHREDHQVTLKEGQALPACRTCGDSVRFTLVRAAAPVEADADFRTGV
jgi:transcription elongation factor Elf1